MPDLAAGEPPLLPGQMPTAFPMEFSGEAAAAVLQANSAHAQTYAAASAS